MDNQLPELRVNMLGRFSITYRDQPITFKRNSATKAVKLLQILLHSSLTENQGNGGISRAQLLDDLFGREELANVGNNLRVTVFRLRKMLIEAGLPEYDYIVKEKGVFYWRSPMKTDLDVVRFVEMIREGEQAEEKAKKMELWEQACRLYKGELLPMQSGEDWVIMNSVHYKEKYSKALRSLCEYKKEQQEYDTILELTDTAMEIYPFDEWQSVKIDALMGMNRYKEAYQLYDATSRMFFEELGITPSERMMNQFQEMSERMGRTYHAAGEIKEDLKEPEYEDGAFYCSLPSFRDNYRLVRRLIERNGQSAFLMVCSLTDGNGHPMENREKLDVMSMELHRAVKGSLRRGDSFSKYSPSQFLILLVGVNQENCDMIFRRIAGRFTDRHGSWNRYLEYYVSSIAEVENPNARLSFQKNEFHWK